MSRHEPGDHRHAIVLYGLVSLAVIAVGAIAIWSFVERQSLRQTLAPEPLPQVTVVTDDTDSELAAGWIDLLTRAQFSPTLVAVGNFTATDGIIALADVSRSGPALDRALAGHLRAGRGIVVFGAPPENSPLGFETDSGGPGTLLRFAEASSPVLARVKPGHELSTAPHPAELLAETSQMVVDARWDGSARAAIAHWRQGGGRILFFGFHPGKLWNPADHDLLLLLRTGFRWVASQPVSEAAAGMPAASKTLSTASRLRARDAGLAWSFDRVEGAGEFVLRLRNDSGESLENPTVKIWFPEDVTSLELSGSVFSKRKVRLDSLEDQRAAIVSIASLGPHEDRYIPISGRSAD